MRWLITDSGLGGLSVCAGLEQGLANRAVASPVELLYVNATPDDRIGYNALATQAERIALFDRFLQASAARYAPDKIIIACNTLSVLYAHTSFAASTRIPVHGIVEAGVELCKQHLAAEPHRDLIIFATETTTEAGTYPQLIGATGGRIIPQACPELAHAISNDATGGEARSLLAAYARSAVQNLGPDPGPVFAFLGCTHYGYQSKAFVEALAAQGVAAIPLDPNQVLVEKLLADMPLTRSGELTVPTVAFVSRYQIPEGEIGSLVVYLRGQAPLTCAALETHSVVPGLFDRA